MTLTARSVIDSARGQHTSFDVSRHPNRVVLQFLSRYVKELHGKVAAINPDVLRANVVASLPLADHAAGIALGTTRFVGEVTGTDQTGMDFPVEIIPPSHRLDRGVQSASCWQIGDSLYLTSPASLWDNVATITAAIVGVPVMLQLLDDELPLPDAAEGALVDKVAAFMAKRAVTDPKAPPLDGSLFAADATASQAAFLLDISNALTGQVIRTRDVYP